MPDAVAKQAWTPYCGAAPAPDEWLSRWNLDPAVLLALAGLIVAWSYHGDPKAKLPFAFAMTLLAFLFVSPLCALTSALFAARAAHHAILIAVVAPMLVWAVPSAQDGARPRLGVWTAAHAAALWAWHVPSLYSAALNSDALYWTMQGTLLGSACLLWRAVRQAEVTSAVAALLVTMVQMGLLGALLTFAAAPLYAPHTLTTAAWGLPPLEDQQLGGLIMWVPASAAYLAAALLLLGRCLRLENRSAA